MVFSHPPIGAVGLTGEEAALRYGADGIRSYAARFTNLYYAMTERESATAMKVITVGPQELIIAPSPFIRLPPRSW